MTDPAAPAPILAQPRSRGFILRYALAQTGAFISFIPLLTLLLPAKAEAIGGPDGAAVVLSQAAFWGGATAAIANLAFGALSDRTRSPLGRRRPWIMGGVAGLLVSFALLTSASTPLTLVVGVVAFQLAVNAFFAPLNALVPDLVPDRQKGLVAAWAGVAAPLANLFTALVISRLHPEVGLQFALVGAAVVLLVLPLLLRLKEAAQASAGFTLSFRALRNRTFAAVWTSRLFAEAAIAIHTLYLFLWVSRAPAGVMPAGAQAAAVFGLLLATATVSTVIAGFIGGVASDRLGRRLPFVVAAMVAMAASLVLLCIAPPWPGVLAIQLLFGAAHGLHATTVAAMTAEILPDRESFGRDLGVMNIAIAVPQSLAPAAVLVLLGVGLPLATVFLMAGAFALLSAGALTFARATRSPGTQSAPEH